jgi:hypothetical protein
MAAHTIGMTEANMGVKSGAGAAVSSGAEYQARVAAYLVASHLCEMPVGRFDLAKLASISFETAESVDDVNLSFSDGRRDYLQVKKAIQFSSLPTSDLYGALAQFVAQYRPDTTSESSYTLVTESGSSRKVTTEMRAALEAFRLGDEESFRRDQPKASVAIIDELLGVFDIILAGASVATPKGAAREILRRTHVLVLDLDPNSTLEHAIVLLLTSRSYIMARELWREIVIDSLNDATHRHTLAADRIQSRYGKFRLDKAPQTQTEKAQFLRAIIKDIPLSTGKEVLFGRFADHQGDSITKTDYAIVELHRFGDNCDERVVFKDGQCHLANGLRIELECRTSTYVGMERFLKSRPDLTTGKTIVMMPSNDGAEDIEKTLCAERHRQALRASNSANADSLACVHCGKAISSASAEMIELLRAGKPEVGLAHRECILPEDRVVGVIECEFFEKYDFLKNFDANLWFHAIQRGQAFLSSDKLPPGAVFAWGGIKSDLLQGGFVIEMTLTSGDTKYVQERGKIHRFRKDEADAFAVDLNQMFEQARTENDPYCLSDQSNGYGKRSLLLGMLGVSEELNEIARAKVVKYDQKIAALYELWENWYAPMAFLTAREDESIVQLGGGIPIISDPMKLDRFIENWRSIGLTVPDYELNILDSDARFDDFIGTVTKDGMQVIVDPVFSKKGKILNLTSGYRLVPMDQILNSNR